MFVRRFLFAYETSNGDMIAQDVVYHKAIYTELNNQLGGYFSDEQRKLSVIVFNEVVAFIEEILLISNVEILTFKLSDLIKQYNTHLLQLGVTLETRIHSTYFKTGYLHSLKIYQLITRRKKSYLCSIKILGKLLLQLSKCQVYISNNLIANKLIKDAELIRVDNSNINTNHLYKQH